MRTVVGVFTSQVTAEQAVERLHRLGMAREHMNFLVPGASATQLEQVPTTETEQPGMGPAIGGVVGGAVGASGGLMTSAVVSALVPGIGTVTAIGLAAIGIIGFVGGALAGAAAGGALENAMSDGLPKDEIFVYHNALQKGRTVLMVLTEDEEQAEVVRGELAQAGAESLDAARENWWVGLRDAEAEAYTVEGRDFAHDEAVYRRGFEAALHPETSGRPYTDVVEYLRAHYAGVFDHEAFRRGYERGRAYRVETNTSRDERPAASYPRG